MAKEKKFTMSVMDDIKDSVVQTGSVKDGTHKSEYFSHYEKAFEYIKEQCKEFVEKDDEEDVED